MQRLLISGLLEPATLALLACAVLAARPHPVPAQTRAADEAASGSVTLERRMSSFLRAVRRHRADSIAAFFPKAGDWTYLHTRHREGGSHVGVWRFRGGEAPQAIRYRGPLWESFELQPEGQPIGLFAHQVLHRGTAWRRVRGARFVPPGASASSDIFVEWRREDGEWVVSAFGDESFKGGPLPAWCC